MAKRKYTKKRRKSPVKRKKLKKRGCVGFFV